MQQIYRRTPMPKYDFALRHRCSPVNLLNIFRTPFPMNTSRLLPLNKQSSEPKNCLPKCSTLVSFIWYVCKIFPKTNISYPLDTHLRVRIKGARNISFSENFVYVLNERFL